MGITIIIAIVTVLFFVIRVAIKTNEKTDVPTSIENPTNVTIANNTTSDHLEKPGNDYCYWELVGMKYRNLVENDYGVHTGYAHAENDNQYDKYAVGIYREDNNKLVAYIPKDFQNRSNKELHYIISKLGGSTPVKFRIWKSDSGYIYGCAYIKEI